MSILADDATLDITGGTFNTPIYMQGRTDTIQSGASEKSQVVASDAKYYAIDGDMAVNITGGTFNGGEISAYYTHAAYTTLVRGNFDVSITGGTFSDGTIIDATQVKAYEGETKKATLTYENVTVTPKRFDVVNGVDWTYDEPTRVIFIGDSITEGYAPPAAGVVRLTDSYSAQFLALCESDEIDDEVIVGNFGIGAAGFYPKTTRDYFKMLAYPMVINETDPTYVFFAMGTNDANTIGGTRGALLEFEKNYKKIAAEMGESDEVKKVFITSAIYRESNASASNRMVTALHPVQMRIADELGEKYVFVDMYGLTLDMAKDYSLFAYTGDADGDLLHPTHSGLKEMGKHCYNAVFNEIYAPTDYKLTDIYISADAEAFGAGTEADPISSFTYACGLMAPDKEVTLHVMGNFDLGASNITLSGLPSKLNIVGYGTGASLKFTGNTFKCTTDTKFDNIKLIGGTAEVQLMGYYNDIEITDTVTMDGTWAFYAGYNIFANKLPSESTTVDSADSASSSDGCVITINGGKYNNLMLGNKICANGAPVGTYSGDITFTLGESVTVGSGNYIGLIGHNYFTGNITANIGAWSGNVNEYAAFEKTYTIDTEYDYTKNAGYVTVTLGEGAENTVCIMFDFDGDGDIGLDDLLTAVKYVFNGIPEDKSALCFGKTRISLVDIGYLMGRV